MRKVISSKRYSGTSAIVIASAILALGVAFLGKCYAQGCAGSGSPFCEASTPVPCQDPTGGKCMTFEYFQTEFEYDGDPPDCDGDDATYVKVITAASWTTCAVANDDDCECSCSPSICQVAKFYTGEDCGQADYCGLDEDQGTSASFGTGEACPVGAGSGPAPPPG